MYCTQTLTRNLQLLEYIYNQYIVFTTGLNFDPVCEDHVTFMEGHVICI